MSSILEALKKLEAEKAETGQVTGLPLDREVVHQELTGRAPINRRITVSTGALVFGGSILGVLLVAASAAVALLVTRTGNPPQVVATVQAPESTNVPANVPAAQTPSPGVIEPAEPLPPPTPSPEPAVSAAAVAQPARQSPSPVPELSSEGKATAHAGKAEESAPDAVAPPKEEVNIVQEPVQETASSKPASSEAQERKSPSEKSSRSEKVEKEPFSPAPVENADMKEEKSSSVKSKKTKSEEPEIPKEPIVEQEDQSMMVAQNESADEAQSVQQERLDPAEEGRVDQDAPKVINPSPLPANIYALPPLRETEKSRLGLRDLQVNMCRPATKSRPQASAIINLQTVYIGETVPGSDAILVGVETRGIAIEVPDTGARYHVRF